MASDDGSSTSTKKNTGKDSATASAGTDGTGKRSTPVWERAWVLWTSSGALLVVLVALVFGALGGHAPQGPAQTSQLAEASTGVPDGMNAATAELLSVAPVPTDPVTAPGWKLTDQNGRALSSSQLRGRVEVLTFNDDKCTDLCVMMSTDIIQADKDLPPAVRKHVVFVSINANPYYPGVADVASWSNEHGLNALPNWEYVTGTPTQLAAMARAYNVPVELDAKTRTIQHGTEIFIISPQGKEVSLASFGAEAADTTPFAHGLAALADDALPQVQQGTVAGTNLAKRLPGGTALDDTPTAVAGPALNQPGTLTTASDRGKYTVLDFWSSTCTACGIQLPDDQAEVTAIHALKSGSSSVGFVGVDVSDTAAAGRSTLARYHVTIPTVLDGSGTQAARFRISQLPYTVVLSPTGKVIVRHPGLFTTDELDYELHALDTRLPGTSD